MFRQLLQSTILSLLLMGSFVIAQESNTMVAFEVKVYDLQRIDPSQIDEQLLASLTPEVSPKVTVLNKETAEIQIGDGYADGSPKNLLHFNMTPSVDKNSFTVSFKYSDGNAESIASIDGPLNEPVALTLALKNSVKLAVVKGIVE